MKIDEAGKYPYQTAYLPFNRLPDGDRARLVGTSQTPGSGPVP